MYERHEEEVKEFEDALNKVRVVDIEDTNYLQHFSNAMLDNTLLSPDMKSMNPPVRPAGMPRLWPQTAYEEYNEDPELLLLPLTTAERRKARRMLDAVTRRLAKAQARAPPADVAVHLASLPREYVRDAVLKYEFVEWHHVQSSVTDVHPGEHKCVLKVHVPDLGFSDEQHELLANIVGPRYNRSSGELKLVAKKYLDKVQNRIHVRLMLDKLIHVVESN